MKREWLTDELAEHWTLSPAEREAVGNKRGATRLGFTVLLKFIQLEGRFPRHAREVPTAVIEYMAPQLGLSPELWQHYSWAGSTGKYHRAEIRRFLGYQRSSRPVRAAPLRRAGRNLGLGACESTAL